MTATETPLPSSGSPSAPVRGLTASAPRVAGLEGLVEELDRAVALQVGDAVLYAGRLDLPGGPRGDGHADLLELGDRPHARRGDGRAGGRDVRAVHQDGGRRGGGQAGELVGQEGLD